MPLISDFVAARHPAAQGRRALASSLPQDKGARVCLTLRVPGLDTQAVRRAVHRALGDRIDVYTLAVDTRRAVTTLQLRVRRGALAALMDAVMAGLPEAEFGAIARAPDAVDLQVLH